MVIIGSSACSTAPNVKSTPELDCHPYAMQSDDALRQLGEGLSHDGHQVLHVADGFIHEFLFSAFELDLDDFFHAARPEDARDADEIALALLAHAILAVAVRSAGNDSLFVLDNGLSH